MVALSSIAHGEKLEAGSRARAEEGRGGEQGVSQNIFRIDVGGSRRGPLWRIVAGRRLGSASRPRKS